MNYQKHIIEFKYFKTYDFYPELKILSDNFEFIKDEIYKIDDNMISEWCNVFEGKIKIYPMYFYGVWSKNTYKLFPNICNLLIQIPNILSVELSILEPNCQITPHVDCREIANNVLRCHLGLDLYEGCGLVCENYVMMHKVNEWITFDNSLTHNAFNFSNKRRLVMIIDMIRPYSIKPVDSGISYIKETLTILSKIFSDKELEEILENINKKNWKHIKMPIPN